MEFCSLELELQDCVLIFKILFGKKKTFLSASTYFVFDIGHFFPFLTGDLCWDTLQLGSGLDEKWPLHIPQDQVFEHLGKWCRLCWRKYVTGRQAFRDCSSSQFFFVSSLQFKIRPLSPLLLPLPPDMTDSGAISWNKLLHKLLLVVVFYPSNRKVTNLRSLISFSESVWSWNWRWGRLPVRTNQAEPTEMVLV